MQEGEFSDGGMSVAILCKDTHLDRPVVIKRLVSGVDPKRILSEIAALQAIRSRHVVQIYDVIKDAKEKIVALVEEYVEGEDLTSLPIPTSANQFMSVIYPVSMGIADIHRHGHIHRDIKRQNMKFDGEGCLKIFDFGLAKDDALDASTIGALGTPGYMAPELLVDDGEEAKFSAAVDVYAFGATSLAIALGKLPKSMRHGPQTFPNPDADFAQLTALALDKEVIELLNSCLSEDASDRPSMQEVSATLALHLLRDRHRALVGVNGQTFNLSSSSPVVDLAVPDQGALRIEYNGLRFSILNVKGSVAINNNAAKNGDVIPGSCVIVLGPPYPANRTTITVDVSHPEVPL